MTDGGSIEDPGVLGRRRIVIADPNIPGSKQPFHAAEGLPIEQADVLIRKCRERSLELAIKAVRDLTTDGHVVAAAFLFASGRPLPALEAILRSHAAIHTAEGEFFRGVLVEASEACGLSVAKIRERDIRDLPPHISALGKALGPPWTQDEKLASVAAWKALANETR